MSVKRHKRGVSTTIGRVANPGVIPAEVHIIVRRWYRGKLTPYYSLAQQGNIHAGLSALVGKVLSYTLSRLNMRSREASSKLRWGG